MAVAWWDASRAEAMICQFTPEFIHQDIFGFCGNQMLVTKMDMPQFLKSNLVKRQIEQPFYDFESVASVVEGSDLGTSEDCLEPTASCINDMCHFKVDVIAGDANAAAYKYNKNWNTKICTIPQLPSC